MNEITVALASSVFARADECIARLDFDAAEHLLDGAEHCMRAWWLRGARETIERCRPGILAEFIKVDMSALVARLRDAGYWTTSAPVNVLAVHQSDPVRRAFEFARC